MKTIKALEDYEKSYGDIPDSKEGIMNKLLSETDLKRQKKDIFNEMERINKIKWKQFRFTIFMLPKSTPRPRFTSRGNMFYVKGAKDNKKIFYEAMKDSGFPMIHTPMKFCCTSYLPIPSGMSKIDRILAEMGFIRPISKPDFDNLAKTYADMIQGIVMIDDALIIEGISKKYYSHKPRIEIIIDYMDDYDCEFNKKKIERWV